ncbi:helix-turn-helix transcriptional regulator [Facklamia sp. DSM 111018]|uniref:Helix-turn-helix transcriptional regulator n=1 Tax=Facklamia lactis TaxID=2749967 RepID=A0ABS0LPA8_9LACT|nr:helix-turn-helix transcriptional regulator [Facklamia lactis]MBG9979529.1 helix-turn-helix transcriptional regulator [Facklamia lactis]MBG9985802.1 helix-turn-helix transcriptional regulator [Facklamia lactis]
MNIGENLYKYRTQLNMTQDELANYLNLTKATISKWENNLSIPDVPYLVTLAKLFNVSVDDLINYQKMLTHQERITLFRRLRLEFMKDEPQAQYEEIQKLFKMYANDYKTLMILIQYLANYYLSLEDYGSQVSDFCIKWLNHIIEHSNAEVDLQMAISLKLMFLFNRQDFDTIIKICNPRPYKLGEELILSKSYAMKGDLTKATEVLQIELYQQTVLIVQYLYSLIEMGGLRDNQVAIGRSQALIDAFDLEHLHPLTALNFYYVAAKQSVSHSEKLTLKYLNKYLDCADNLLTSFELHGDEFFDAIDDWLVNLPTGKEAPFRPNQMISAVRDSILGHPCFDRLKTQSEYQNILDRITEIERKFNHDEFRIQ